MQNLTTQGFVLLDVDVAALNNAGKSQSSNLENAVATKKIRKNGRYHTYVSGQAWRYWWRNTLQKQAEWSLSPITRDDKVAFTAANPIKFDDDDIFGYMKATKDVKLDEKGQPVKDKKGNEVKEDATVTRVSPLKNSALISVASVQVEGDKNFSVMSRHQGDPVPYSKEEYSAVMKGMFSLDLEMVGTFASYNKTGFKNLSQKLREEALASGATEIADPHLPTAAGEAHKLVRLEKRIREKRATDTIAALKFINGGAMQTNNMADVTPKFIVLATMASGNHPFSHVATSFGQFEQEFRLNVEGLEEVLNDYGTQFRGKIFIGIRSGFLSDEDVEKLESLAIRFGDESIFLGPVNAAIDEYIEQLKTQIP
ncbi:MAG: type I-B CRISPR-associated protein Cas7/Cst2/DevR [Saprospiraceae bacterium]